MKQQYLTFDDLPQWAQERIRMISACHAHTWVFEPIPALEGESVMSLMNQGEEGQMRVRSYLDTVIGKFF